MIYYITFANVCIFVGKVVDYKRLRGGIKLVNDIPKTPSFKLRRRFIRDMILNGEI